MSNSHPMSVIRKTGRNQAATGSNASAEGRIHVPLKDHATPTRASDSTTGNARLSTPKVHLVAGKNFEAENSKAPVLANPVRFQPLRSTCEASRQATGSGVNVKMHVNKPTHSIGPGPRIYVYNTIPPQVYTQAPASKQDQRVPQASSTNRDINRSHLPAAPFDEDAARHDKALVSNGHGSLITGTKDVFFPQHTQESELEELCDDGKEAVQEQRRQDNLKHLIIKTEKDWAVLTIDTSQLKQAGYPSSEEPGYGMSSSSQQSSQGIPSNFPYNDSAGLYSQSPVGGYMDGPHGAHHPPAGAQIYPSYPSQVAGVVGVGISPQAIGVAQQAQYLQPGQASSQRVPISHTTRASPITVQWLLENYETADGVSLPRSTLYNHYLRHCADSKIDAVNAASFGKLIRSVFLGLKTRRLGTRGNSKYHYYGIRVKPNSPLARLTDDTQVALRAQPSSTKRSASGSSFGGSRPSSGHSEPGSGSDGPDSAPHSSHRQYLGNAADGLSDLPVLDLTDFIPDGISKQEFANFGTLYRHHCEALLEVVSNLQFDLVESLWQAFWKSPAAVNKGESGTFESSDVPFETHRLVAVCRCKPVQKFVKETDYILYQKIVDILIPNVLRAIPSSLTQGIRNFAKSLENILIGSMSEMPKEIVNVKVAAVSAFSQTLRRYTSLNHLAQAARAVLQNPQQINQMWTDLNKVDFTNVQEQSSWVCQCDEALIQKLEQDFKQTLGQQQSLEQWAQWLENVVGLVLGDHEGQETYPKAARQFLLNWSFYSSMIIRDLTLRSAASFGSFHLIRLLYDEYMFYLIEHKVAAFSGKSPLAVMGECMGLSSFSSGDSFSGSANGDDDDNDEDSPDDEDDEGSLLTVPPLTQTILMAVGQHDPMLGSRSSDELLNVGARVTADQVMSQAFSEPEMKRMKTEYLA